MPSGNDYKLDTSKRFPTKLGEQLALNSNVVFDQV
jgi:hypothetical protein